MSRWPDDYVPLNGCSECGLDFTSLEAFDRHRVGMHAYDFALDRPDGRRCLDSDELAEHGLAVLTVEELARSRRHAHRAGSGVALVHDPERAEGVRRRFAEQRVLV